MVKPAFFVALCAMATPLCFVMHLSEAKEVVQQLPAQPGHTLWRISEPRVNQKSTEYPQIDFHPGETVTVTGSGCVQTGGAGHTWKRWVDPAGKKSDNLYHGRVSIPGATPGLVPIDLRVPAAYDIPASANIPAGAHLTLGYTDDSYSDNGYHDRNNDDGNYSQCWKLGNAVVTVDIGPLAPALAPPASANYTFKVESVYIRNLRARQNDTDVLGAAVIIDGTQSAIAKTNVGNWGRGGPHAANFGIDLQQITPTNRIAITYTILNAGHGNENKINSAVVSIVEQVGSKIPVYGSIVAAVAAIEEKVLDIADANCDGVVFGDVVEATGADLAAWTRTGPYRRTVSFPGYDSAVGCGGNSFYEVTYSVTKNSHASSALQFNAATLRSLVTGNSQVLKPQVHH